MSRTHPYPPDRGHSSELPTEPPSHRSPDPEATIAGPPRSGSSPNTGGSWPAILPAQLGRYRLLQLLGKGGMGSVYLAHDSQLGRRVALKIPTFGGENVERQRERFLREAQAAAKLSHPNLCSVYDVGEIDGVFYLTMAFIEGHSLSAYVKARPKLPARPSATVIRHLALAMQEAHDRGIIHRDLKPANIMMTPRKLPVVMDFGLARQTDIDGNDPSRLTQAGTLMGTPAYMPPEQLDGDRDRIGPCSDIYSLGVILYEMLAGRPPFVGQLTSLVTQIAMDAPAPLRQFRNDVDPALESICRKALQKKPEDRYKTMRELAADIEKYLRGDVTAAAENEDIVLYEIIEPVEVIKAPRSRSKIRKRHQGMPVWGKALIAAGIAFTLLISITTVTRLVKQYLEEKHISAQLEKLRRNADDSTAWDAVDSFVRSAPAHSPLLLPVGKYLLLERDDASRGLDLLSRCDDHRWRRLAAAELAGNATTADYKELAGEWWDAAKAETGLARAKLFWRSCRDYERAMPSLAGDDKTRAMERIKKARGAPDLAEKSPVNKVAGRVTSGVSIKPPEEFVLELTGKTDSPNSSGWSVAVGSPNASEAMISVNVNPQGIVTIKRPTEPKEEKLVHRIVERSGQGNRVMMVFKGRQVEMYVNGMAIRDPILFDRPPATDSISIMAGYDAEVYDLRIWSAEGVASLADRAAGA